jgi:hypothetical protein
LNATSTAAIIPNKNPTHSAQGGRFSSLQTLASFGMKGVEIMRKHSLMMIIVSNGGRSRSVPLTSKRNILVRVGSAVSIEFAIKVSKVKSVIIPYLITPGWLASFKNTCYLQQKKHATQIKGFMSLFHTKKEVPIIVVPNTPTA